MHSGAKWIPDYNMGADGPKRLLFTASSDDAEVLATLVDTYSALARHGVDRVTGAFAREDLDLP
eukprot:6119122-Pyramimonas_sp.AAC.1